VRFEAARPLPKSVQKELTARGHRLRPLWSAQGDANCVLVADGVAYAYADPRETGGLALAARTSPP
jgi:gamma-glutamyltranspeptidase